MAHKYIWYKSTYGTYGTYSTYRTYGTYMAQRAVKFDYDHDHAS